MMICKLLKGHIAQWGFPLSNFLSQDHGLLFKASRPMLLGAFAVVAFQRGILYLCLSFLKLKLPAKP